MIQASIHKATKILPLYWPLQRSIAMNPLWYSTDQSFFSLSMKMSYAVGISATLPLSFYFDAYKKRAIDDDSIKRAICDILPEAKQEFVNISTKEMHFVVDLLFDFITLPYYQLRLDEYEKTHQLKNTCHVDILICAQVRPYFIDDPLEWVLQKCLGWLAAFFDLGQAVWQPPTKEKDIWAAWRDMQSHQNKFWRNMFQLLPTNNLLFIEKAIQILKIPTEYLDRYILQIVWQLKGWCSYVKWLNAITHSPWMDKEASLESIIAIWLSCEVYFYLKNEKKLKDVALFSKNIINIQDKDDYASSLWKEYLIDKKNTLCVNEKIFLESHLLNFGVNELLIRHILQLAWEYKHQKRFLKNLLSDKRVALEKEHVLPKSQWVFCIDTRSERLRRHIEQVGQHETFGAGGFFGFIFQLTNRQTKKTSWQCPPWKSPAIIEPGVSLKYLDGQNDAIKKNLSVFSSLLKEAKNHSLAPFALFDMIGVWSGMKILGKTFCPKLYNKIGQYIAQKDGVICAFKNGDDWCGFDIKQAVGSAEGFLKGMGLISGFAEFIIICGHQAKSNNNPYQASLDCGACGGNTGTPNAIVACKVLNNAEVRSKLSAKGIVIPETTQFIPACHNTTTDTVEWLIDFPIIQQTKFSSIENDTQKACERLRKERLTTLPHHQDVFNRATHWAELIPEWALVNNAAMIVGPRSLSAKLNLEGRVFLHSYEPDLDDLSGSALESILTSPVVVAHWINAQYYFSATDPSVYGSGNKAIHNIVSGLGVMVGNSSDLQLGLPQQSVFHLNQLIHEPRRLFVVIYAKKELVETILNKHTVVKNIFDGKWAFLHIINPQEEIKGEL